MSRNNQKTVSTCQTRTVPAGEGNFDHMRNTTAVDDQFILHPDDAKQAATAAVQAQQDAAKVNAGRMAVIIAALESAQNQIGGGRPDGSSDPNADDYDCDADLWDYFQRAIDAAKEFSV